MTIDERLEKLTCAVEQLTADRRLLHQDMAEFYAQAKRQEKREQRTRIALGAAIAAYLDALREDGGEE